MDSRDMDKSIVCGFFGPPCRVADPTVIPMFPAHLDMIQSIALCNFYLFDQTIYDMI